jgi:hypothetical protein
MVQIIYAPKFIDPKNTKKKLFLAGSIENGLAEQWQQIVAAELSASENLLLLNPRRPEWNINTEGSELEEQISWELFGLEIADGIFFYFDPNTKSPITLLELGLCLNSTNVKPMFVVCPDGYFRKTNVVTTVERYGQTVYNTLEDALTAVKEQF